MENTEFFDEGIEEVKLRIKEKIEEINVVDKELSRLKSELKRKEAAKSIYFGEKKKIKPKKSETIIENTGE